ncbi:MAG: hypothetical protein ACK5P4_04075 [Bacteroidota bacterium]|jgi:hypothetical protein
MLPEIKYLPVNWIDGMKISESHFLQSENSITDRIRDNAAILISSNNYGLLKPKPGRDASFNLSINVDQSKLMRVKLLECRAITAGGMRIEIGGEYAASINTFETKVDPVKDEEFYVVVAINPYDRIPVGEPDPAEVPLRYPHVIPSYSLQVINSVKINTNLNPAYHLIIGKIRTNGVEVVVDNDFIPPCSCISAFPKLKQEYQELGGLLGEIGTYATTIVQKVKTEKQKTDLAINVNYLAEKIVFFLAEKIAKYRWTVSQQPPVYMIETFLSFAYIIKSCIDCQTEKDRESMITYFQEWTGLSPAQFQKRLNDVIEIEYNHQDIALSIREIKTFTQVMVKLFKQMSKLKYIGDQVDSGVVIGETREQKKPEPKRGWSFLND